MKVLKLVDPSVKFTMGYVYMMQWIRKSFPWRRSKEKGGSGPYKKLWKVNDSRLNKRLYQDIHAVGQFHFQYLKSTHSYLFGLCTSYIAKWISNNHATYFLNPSSFYSKQFSNHEEVFQGFRKIVETLVWDKIKQIEILTQVRW